MTRLFSISLVLIILFLETGVSYAMHYCVGQIVSSSAGIGRTERSCEMELNCTMFEEQSSYLSIPNFRKHMFNPKKSKLWSSIFLIKT